MVINIKQYLTETNSVLLTEQAYKYLKEKASVIEKLEEIKSDMDIIAELEAIKAEFEDKILLNQTVAIQIMDKHIAELKKENDIDCRNCDKWKTCENGEKGHANGTSIGYSIGECRDYVELKGE